MSELTSFLQEIRPDLTVYGVLLTFAIISIYLGRFFWNYEQKIMAENINRVRDILNDFRRRYIEPVITDNLSNYISQAYEVAIAGLIDELYPQRSPGDPERTAVKEDRFKQIVSESALFSRLEGLKIRESSDAESFVASPAGMHFLDSLERHYTRAVDFSQMYSRLRAISTRIAYLFFGLALVLLLGLLRLPFANWPGLLFHFWLFLLFLLFSSIAYSIVVFEIRRRKFLAQWETIQLASI